MVTRIIITDLPSGINVSKGYEHSKNRELVKLELLELTRPSFSFESYYQPAEDKSALKRAKNQWRLHMKKDNPDFTKRNCRYSGAITLDGFKELMSKSH